jgi:tripartite-type tricarboxylate transporter receptor subunit TctC
MRLLAAAAIAALSCVAVQPTLSADFYQGKRLTVLINFAPGGSTDIEGRLIARHIGKHIPGNPSIIVQNMDGAGGLVGLNYLGEVAPKDGSVTGYFTAGAWSYVTARERHRVDFLSYSFVGFQPGSQVYFVRADTKPGIKTPADIFKAEDLVIGGLAADSTKDMQLRLLADIMGIKYKYVTGYKGNAGARIALERGEISMFSESVPGYASQIEPNIIAKGVAVPLFYDPGFNGREFFVPDMAKGVNVKPFHVFFKEATGRDPSGPHWEIYKKMLAIDLAMLRIMVLPPNAPREAVDAIRIGLRKLPTDPEFISDAQKLVNFVPTFVATDDVQQIVRNAVQVSDDDRKWIAAYIANAPK